MGSMGCAPRGIGRWSRVRVEKPREGDVDVGLGARVRRRRRGRRPRAHLSVVSPIRDPTRFFVKLSAQNLASFITSLGATMEEEGALDRREMSPLQRRAAATRRRIEAARAETAHHPKPQRGRMFAAPNAPPPSSPGNSPLTVLEDRRNGSPYNIGRTAVSGSGDGDPSSSSLATPSGINTRARMEIRQRARKIQLCTPMSAQWFRCGT